MTLANVTQTQTNGGLRLLKIASLLSPLYHQASLAAGIEFVPFQVYAASLPLDVQISLSFPSSLDRGAKMVAGYPEQEGLEVINVTTDILVLVVSVSRN